ncbi:MAG: hypothetical protein KDH96_06330 [Candidatus Riesia sp.]|nr:hypothetical protein [Candidatus Riesia sp.]
MFNFNMLTPADVMFYYFMINNFDDLLIFYYMARGNYFFELVLNENFEYLLDIDCGYCKKCHSMIYKLFFKYID